MRHNNGMANQARNVLGSHNLSFAPASDDDAAIVGDDGACTVKQDKFAEHWARHGNKAAAYRQVYALTPNTAPNTIYAAATRIGNLPQVERRMREYRQQFALETIASAQEVGQVLWDIVTADPNEIIYTAKRCCRYCYGVDHRYQWIDENEYFEAVAKAIDADQKSPTDAGGYGYARALEPAHDCPHCLGDGWAETVICDTRKLSGPARRLYAGMDFKKGEWVPMMHDKMKAVQLYAVMIGAAKGLDELRSGAQRAAAAKIPDGLNEADTARAYLTLVT